MKKIDIVCIIDDDPTHVFVASRALEIGNFCETILVFRNGKEAYDKLKAICVAGEKLPDLILLDINMPVWDGWDFLSEFIKIPIEKKITIYIITSSNNPEDMRRAESFNIVSNFLIKPITIDKLKQEFSTMTS